MKRPTMTADELAQHWRCTPRWVRAMAGEGVAVRIEGADEFDVLASDSALIDWLRRDEASRRVRREHLRSQIQQREQAMQAGDRRLLDADEVQQLVVDAWDCLWSGHVAAMNSIHREALAAMGTEGAASLTGRIDASVKSELRVAQERLEIVLRRRLADLDHELRNGIIRRRREIERLQDAVGA
jgi:hypothetical protein